MRDGPRGFTQDFSCPALLRCRPCRVHAFGYGAVTLSGPAFQPVPLAFARPQRAVLQPPAPPRRPGFGLLRVRSPLLAESLLFSLPPGIEMFQFPGFAPGHEPGAGIASGGLPHSEIRGSKGICPSPRLIAAYHVLLRLREPRHPSCALVSFP